VLLHEILEPKQVVPCCRERVQASAARDPLGQRVPGAGASRGGEQPCAIPRRLVLEQYPLAGRGCEAAAGPGPDPGPVRKFRGKRGPIQAEVRAYARILRDTQVVLDQEAVYGPVHRYQMVTTW
jgi:hypothetical protein